MLKDSLKFLVSICKSFISKTKPSGLFDIVVYGSSMKGKNNPTDTDIILLFKEIDLNKRLEIAQNFKNLIKTEIKNPDVKTINLSEFFEVSFLARQGILIEGHSLVHDSSLSERLGFKGYSLFSYNLKNLNHNDKTKFTYSLIGRSSEGILKLTGAVVLG